MVVRTRVRALIFPLIFYMIASMLAGYFVWHALNGQRGVKTRDEYAQKISALQLKLDELKTERQRWSKRIELVRGEAIDKDILDEEARLLLGRVHKNEVVILMPEAQRR